MSQNNSYNLILKAINLFLIVITFHTKSAHSGFCSSDSQCSQLCGFGWQCVCSPGFQLGTDGKSCNPADPSWKILYATSDQIFLIPGDGTALEEVYIPPQASVISVTYDAKHELVYFIANMTQSDKHEPPQTIVLRKAISSNVEDTIYITNLGLLSPNSIAFDYVTGNIYYIESFFKRITVCGNSVSNDCAVVLISTTLSTGHSLTLHPKESIMFWIEVKDGQSTIHRADMDGLNPRPITQPIGSKINSLAVDQWNGRIYWSAVSVNVIKSLSLDGQNGRSTSQAFKPNIQSIDVFGNNVFWLRLEENKNGQSGTIWNADKFTGNVERNFGHVLPGSGQKIAVYHRNQPERLNPCQYSHCPYLCVLSPTQWHRCLSPRCIIRPVRTAVVNCYATNFCFHENFIDLSITKDSDYLVLAYNNVLEFTVAKNLNNFRRRLRLERIQIPGIKTISALVYNPFNDTIIMTDSKRIFEYDLYSNTTHELVEAGESNVLSMAHDEIGENLYWISDDGTVTVRSLVTGRKLELIRGLGKVCQILIMANRNSFLVAVKDASEGIVLKTYRLDGSALTTNYDITGYNKDFCATLAYDEQSHHIFWAVPSYNIGIFAVDLLVNTVNNTIPIFSSYQQHQHHYPSSIVRYGSNTYWLDYDAMNLRRLERFGGEIVSRAFLTEGELCQGKEDSIEPLKPQLVILNRLKFSSKDDTSKRLCTAYKCSHLCLVSSPIDDGQVLHEGIKTLQCHCSSGYVLKSDGKTCVKKNPVSSNNAPMHTGGMEDMITGNYNSEETPEEGTNVATISFAVALSFMICLTSGVLLYYLRRGKSNKQQVKLSESEIQEFFHGAKDASEKYEKEAYDKPTWEIRKDYFDIDRNKPCGKGSFGKIYMGSIKRNVFLNYTDSEAQSEVLEKEMRMIVSIKTCTPRSHRALKGLLSEIKLLAHVGQHENIASLIGAYTLELSQGLVYSVTEFCELGCLLDHLHQVENEDGSLSLVEKWTLEIATGMEFLAEKKVVHGALSTKNIHLTSSKTAKITGFGGAILKGSNYLHKKYHDLSAWRWMAPDTLESAEFNEKSDVWAFGVTLWEIHTFGKIPFARLSQREYSNLIKVGDAFLEKPDSCDSGIYSLMLKCWNLDPRARPMFAQLKEALIDMLNSFY